MSTTTTTNDPNKKKALDLALSTIEKQFGKGAIMKLDSESTPAGPVQRPHQMDRTRNPFHCE